MSTDHILERLAKYAKLIESRWRGLSDGERLTLMALCCPTCGALKPKCGGHYMNRASAEIHGG